MTLKRYQPARRRKRSSKKNRPLMVAVALGVVGVAAGLAYASLHGEMLMGLLDGSLDLPDHRFHAKERPATLKAAPATKVATGAPGHGRASASPASLKLVSASAQPLRAASPGPSIAPMQQAAEPKPSEFPEHGQRKDDDPIAEASPLKPAGEASLQPEKAPAVKTAVAVRTAAPVKSPVPVKPAALVKAASPLPKPSPTARIAQAPVHPSPRPSTPAAKATPVAAKPAAKPRPVAATSGGQRMGSLYFDKNSSYLSAAEQDRLARLVGGIKQQRGTIHVSGFADALGDAGYNRWMAQRRASRVAELIRSQTGGKVNVVVDAVGSVGNTTSTDGERQNRRVEVEVR